MTSLFHIAFRDRISAARESGHYEPPEFAREGFIHCSYAHQLEATANRLFRGRHDLVLLEIDPEKTGVKVVDENLEGGTELFPHLYGTLPLSAVVAIHDFACDSEGRFTWPARKRTTHERKRP